MAILTDEARRTLLTAVAEARAAGSLVAFDPNYRARLWPSLEAAREAVTQALAVADIALPTLPDEQALFADASADATAERLGRAGVREIVVKNGEEPALIVADAVTSKVAAVRVENAVDTTGAGDSFNGGYLAARLLGHSPAQAAERAHRVAAAVVQVRGAVAPFETLRAAFGN